MKKHQKEDTKSIKSWQLVWSHSKFALWVVEVYHKCII